MIVGLGSDIARIDRIEQTLAKFGARFEQRCFTPAEQARANRREHDRSASYAKRFAAKEACSKALGTGMRRGVAWRDMGVTNLPSGAPTMALTGGAAARLAELTPSGHRAVIHLTLTDDYPHAMAVVIIEVLPAQPA